MTNLRFMMEGILLDWLLIEGNSPLKPEHPSYQAILKFHQEIAKYPTSTPKGLTSKAQHIASKLKDPDFQRHLQAYDPTGDTAKALFNMATNAAKMSNTGVAPAH